VTREGSSLVCLPGTFLRTRQLITYLPSTARLSHMCSKTFVCTWCVIVVTKLTRPSFSYEVSWARYTLRLPKEVHHIFTLEKCIKSVFNVSQVSTSGLGSTYRWGKFPAYCARKGTSRAYLFPFSSLSQSRASKFGILNCDCPKCESTVPVF
jgi:hypothetical protein